MFQNNAFQSNAFQMGSGGGEVIPAYNGRKDWEYTPAHYELQNNRRKLEKLKAQERDTEIDLLSVKYKIDDIEFKRLRDLADEKMQLQLLLLLKEEQRLIKLLAEFQAQQLLYINNEETMLLLLACF